MSECTINHESTINELQEEMKKTRRTLSTLRRQAASGHLPQHLLQNQLEKLNELLVHLQHMREVMEERIRCMRYLNSGLAMRDLQSILHTGTTKTKPTNITLAYAYVAHWSPYDEYEDQDYDF